jgi:hypothetical protein
MSSEKRWIKLQPLDRLVPPFEEDLVADGGRHDAEGLGDVGWFR